MGTGGVFLRKLRAKVADEPTGFVWVEKGKVAGSGYPASRSQLEWLVKNGIGSILTLTEEPLPKEWLEGLSVRVWHVPMKDHETPSVKSIEAGVRFIEDQTGRGRAVLVHCLAGEGRTGCVLSAYMVRAKGMGAEEAIKALRKLKPEFVEKRQEETVREFASGQAGSEESQ